MNSSVTLRPVIYAQYRRNDGTYPVRIRVTFARKSRFVSTNLVASQAQLTKGLKIKDAALNLKVENLLRDFRKAVSELNYFALQSMTVDDVVAYLLKGGSETFSLDFPTFARTSIASKGKGAKNYTSALNSLIAFLGKERFDISVLTSSTLHRYELWLKQRHGENARAVSLYLSSVAHLHHLARKQYNDAELNLIRIPNPFGNYTPPKQADGHHRNLPPAIINLMLFYRSRLEGRERLGVDTFLISFSLMGMNAPDLFSLSTPSNGIVFYNRTKTKDRRNDQAEMRVRLEQVCQWLYDEYKGHDGRLFNFAERYANYVNYERAVNIGLHQFEERFGLPPLTLYVARHTWATTARTSICGIDKSTVNDCMCHLERGMKVTDIYADKDWTTLWEANRKVQSFFAWEE